MGGDGLGGALFTSSPIAMANHAKFTGNQANGGTGGAGGPGGIAGTAGAGGSGISGTPGAGGSADAGVAGTSGSAGAGIGGAIYVNGNESIKLVHNTFNSNSASTSNPDVFGSSTTPSDDDAFLDVVYEELLDRPIDPGGEAAWSNVLANGGSRIQIIQAITHSQEYRTLIVDGLFDSLLGRDADPSGEAFFVGAMQAGATTEQVEAAIIGSPEFYQHAGNTDSAFLDAVYSAILGRAVDASGANI